MTLTKTTNTIALAGLGLAACVGAAAAAEPLKIDFANDTVGADPASFLSVVGVWRIEAEGSKKVLAVDGRQWKEGQAVRRRRRQGARALRRALCRVSRPRAGLCVFPLYGRQGRAGFPQWRNLGAVRRDFRPHRSRCRRPLQPQAKRRLSDGARQPAREQSGAVEVREGQALVGEMDSRHADRHAPVARPQGPHRRHQGRRLISTASSISSTRCRRRCPGASACGRRRTVTSTSTITRSTPAN